MPKAVKWILFIILALAAMLAFNLLMDRNQNAVTPGNGDPIDSEPEKQVQVFFNNSRLDPEFSCYKVFPVTRMVPAGQDEKIYAVAQLLAGPTEEEKADHYETSINEGTALRSLLIDDGTAYADFNNQLGFEVGGSCRVGAIRAQINETLKQFDDVDDVVISIEGKTEEILEP
jgi:spore germination protein GerM